MQYQLPDLLYFNIAGLFFGSGSIIFAGTSCVCKRKEWEGKDYYIEACSHCQERHHCAGVCCYTGV